MGIWDLLEDADRTRPGKVAVIDGPLRLTWGEIARRARALAFWLRRHGVGPGDRISILEPNTHRFFEAYFAAAGLGAILNPLNLRLSADELAFTIRDAGSVCLLADPAFGAPVAKVLPAAPELRFVVWTGAAPPPALAIPTHAYERILGARYARFEPASVTDDAVAHLYHTSGTTGRPKGVMLTHRNVLVHARNAVAELGLGPDDVWGHIAPMFHLADAWAVFAMTLAGGVHAMLPRFEAEAALDLVESRGITISNLVPTMLNLMVRHPSAAGRDYQNLRRILSGGAPIAPALVKAVMDTFGGDYVQTYGMTETSPYLTLSLLDERHRALPPEEQLRRRAMTGRPFRGVELRVVREDGSEVRPDGREVGEIQVRGETVTPGYWNWPEETAAAFDGGWLRTGDLAVRDEEGWVDIVDRKKDVIITGGEKVWSTEIEAALYAHPAVLEAAAFGRPDDVWGEVVTAAVVLRPGTPATGDEILAWCRTRLSPFKVPKRIEFLAEIPKTGSGKIAKRLLREKEPT